MVEDAAQEERERGVCYPVARRYRDQRHRGRHRGKLPTRLFLPNERAIEPQITSIYRRFGLNDRQIEILARATPKRDYYCQSRRGNRLFELGLGSVALAFTAASSKADQAAIADLLASEGRGGFVAGWLRHKGLDWAVDLLESAAAPDAAAVLEEVGS
jgi:type IV secretion system protein VirB4